MEHSCEIRIWMCALPTTCSKQPLLPQPQAHCRRTGGTGVLHMHPLPFLHQCNTHGVIWEAFGQTTENSLRRWQREFSVCLLGERENHIRNGSFVQVKEYLVNMAKS